MIKSFSAATREIDDVGAAVAEIKEALNLEKNMLKNSLGIITCFSEFDDTGVLKAICETLPFDCIGATSCLSSAGGETDQIIFAITVLTSDDCTFQTTVIPITESYGENIGSAVSEMFKKSGDKPKLLLSYFPLINTVGCDLILMEIDKASGGIPLFGTVAIDHTVDYSTSKTILNGAAYREAVVLGAIYGNPNFSFDMASLDESKIRKQKAIITASDNNILTGVNGKSVPEYLEEIGLTKDEIANGLNIIPLVVDYNDGTKPVARAIYALTPEGHAICGGSMPVGATLALGRLTASDVLSTTEKTLQVFVERNATLLAYSCMSRYVALGMENSAEAEKVIEIAGNHPYLLASSSGEICPLLGEDNKLKNYHHNFTNVLCKIS